MKKGFLKGVKVNRIIFIQVIMLFLLLAFCMPKTSAQTSLAISEMQKTGDYKKNDNAQNGLTEIQNGITVTTSKENNAELSKDTAIKINVSSTSGIKRVEAILYDAKTSKVVNSSFYVDSSGANKETVLSIKTTSFPIERLVLKINVTDEKGTSSFERTYLMKKSILTIYSQSLSDEMISGSTIEFYADASNSSVPVKYIEYTLKEGTNTVQSGKYYLINDSYYITETGEISYSSNYKSEGNGTFKSEYANSRLISTITLPNKSCTLTLSVKASDLLGNVQTKEKTFTLKEASYTFNVTNKNKTLKVGNKINASCISSASFGLSKLEATITDKNDKFISKQTKTSNVSKGDSKLELDITVPDKDKINVYLTATDISGNKKEYGPVSFDIVFNEQEVNPIFVISSEPKMMGSSEVVSVTSNAGILFSELTVKITDEKGNVIKDSDGTSKLSMVSSSVGKTNLETTIYYPEVNLDEVYFVFSAKDIYGNVYDGGKTFSELSDVYKKGPIEIYSNRITISTSPQTGLINKNSEIKLTVKADVVSNPIEKIEYTYYSSEKKSLPSGYTLNSKMPCILEFSDGNSNIQTQVNIAKVTSDIIAIDIVENNKMKKNGYVLYATRPRFENGSFRASAYYVKEESNESVSLERALYSISTGYEVLDYGIIKETKTQVIKTIKGPARNASEIILEIKATDINGKTKISTFNYYQNKSSLKINCYPDSGTVYSKGYIKADAASSAGKNIISFSYEVYDENNKLLLNGNESSINENGQIELDYELPEVTNAQNIKVIYTALDSDGNVSKENYDYLLKPLSDYKDNSSNLTAIAARLNGGVNEYVIKYKDENGEIISATLNKQEAYGINYFYTNVKEMELLSLSEINEVLTKKNYKEITNIEDIIKIYTRLNLYYTLTNRIGTNNEFIDTTRNIKVELNDDNYLGIKNATIDLGNGSKISDLLDIDMRNEILSKAQKQTVEEIDFNALGTSDVIKNVYNPDKITQSSLKAKTYTPNITFNDTYITNKGKLSLSDIENGKAFTNDLDVIDNNVHIYLNKYMLENYSVNIVDNSIHKNHIYTIDENGEIIETCSDECVIYPETKTVTCYYNGTKVEREVTQSVKAEYTLKYLNASGQMSIAGSGDAPKYDDLGRVFIKVQAIYTPKSIYDIVQESEYGEFGVEINSAYSSDGEVKYFTKESNGKWVYIEGITTKEDDTLKVAINPKSYANSLYYNKEKSRYERSSDRGNTLTFTVSDSLSQLKNIKVSYKLNDKFVSEKTIYSFTQEQNVHYKETVITLPEDVLKYGGNVDIKITASNYNGEETDGKVKIAGKTEKEYLSVFINTTKGTNPIPTNNNVSTSLINQNGTINTDVLKEIGEGKTNSDSSALKITKVYDTKWSQTQMSFDVKNMAMYYNSVNDTIGLGYKVSFSLDTVGYGTNYYTKNNKVYSDKLICQMKFYAKINNEYKEVIPYVKENNTYEMCSYSNKFRQLIMDANPNTNNDDSIGLNNININGENVTWNFSYYLPSNAKFKLKDDLEGDYVSPSEIAVQMDIELYKYYSIEEETNNFIKNGQYNDSRHLYTLRENAWNNEVTKTVTKTSGTTIKNIKVKLRDLVDTTKGLVYWYDVIKNALFDIQGNKAY